MNENRDSFGVRAKALARRLKDGGQAQQIWRDRVIAHATAVNSYVAKGLSEGWDNVGKEPSEPDLEYLVDAALNAVRRANKTGNVTDLRELWPPAHGPLIKFLEKNGQSIPTVCFLDDLSVVARIGSPYEQGRTVLIRGDEVEEVPNVEFFGRCPNRRYFAFAKPGGVEVVDGWQGPSVVFCPWPTGKEGIPQELDVAPLSNPPAPTQLLPFPDGRRVLFVSTDGVFVLSEVGARRLLPTEEEAREFLDWSLEEYPNECPALSVAMEHGAISKSGELIAVGSQDSYHLVFDSALNIIGKIGPLSSYPNFAMFSHDDSVIAFNSCHFYDGITVGVPTALLPGLETKAYEVIRERPYWTRLLGYTRGLHVAVSLLSAMRTDT